MMEDWVETERRVVSNKHSDNRRYPYRWTELVFDRWYKYGGSVRVLMPPSNLTFLLRAPSPLETPYLETIDVPYWLKKERFRYEYWILEKDRLPTIEWVDWVEV